VDELDGHRAFADGGGDALDGAGADIAGGESVRSTGAETTRPVDPQPRNGSD
jgi:hypothetical protein